jgi:hypothetical protein
MRRPLLLSLFLVIVLAGQTALAANTLTADEAKNHIGENATVCGLVAGVHYAATTRGQPTFINFDKGYPDQPFTVVIWGEDLAKFNPGPISWDKKRVCATGKITSYQDKPEIVAKSPGQVTVGEAKSK